MNPTGAKLYVHLETGDTLLDFNGDYVTIQQISYNNATREPLEMLTNKYAIGNYRKVITMAKLKKFFHNDGKYFFVYNEGEG